MGTFIDGAAITEAGLLPFLFALWITWLGLRGLLRAMPAAHRNTALVQVMPSQPAENRGGHETVTRTARNGAR